MFSSVHFNSSTTIIVPILLGLIRTYPYLSIRFEEYSCTYFHRGFFIFANSTKRFLKALVTFTCLGFFPHKLLWTTSFMK